MSVTPYSHSKDTKKQQVAEMFDAISGKYDFLNRSLSFGIDVYWRKKMVWELKKMKPQSILDIATGTGDVALTMQQLHPEKIIGVDISDGMLEIGREKIQRKGLQEIIQLQNGDSENLQFAANSFDAITVAFGVRNFENLSKGLSEMHRVLRPGGKVVILEFSKPKIFPIKQLYNFYFKYFCPWFGKLISKDTSAYQYLFDSVKAFPEGKQFTDIAEKSGFSKMNCERVTFGIVSLYTAVK